MTRFADQMAYLRNECLPTIRAHGWMCVGYNMPSGDPAGALTYTAGLTEAGVSELAIATLPHEPAAVMLNFMARLHLEKTLRAGVRVPMPNATELLLVDGPGVIGPVARALYGKRVSFLQALWPNPLGQYPTNPGWPHDVYPQPVYDAAPPAYMMPEGDGLVGALDEVSHRRGGE